MLIVIRPGSDLPIYRQIVRQVVDAIAGGRLVGGEQLPSHRELSEQLGIAPLTVKRAYDELEAQGYLATERGRGTFVRERSPRAAQRAQSVALHEAARALLAQAYVAGLTLGDVIAVLRDTDRALTHDSAPRGRKDD